MSLREWLIIIGALIIIGVVVDGLRRMHRARQDSLEISRGMGSADLGESPVDDDYNPELPGGGARVVSPGTVGEGPSRVVSSAASPTASAQPEAPASEGGVDDDTHDSVPVITRPQSEPEPESDAQPTTGSAFESESDERVSADAGVADDLSAIPDENMEPEGDGIVGEVRVRTPSQDSTRETEVLKAERDDDFPQPQPASRASQAAAETAQAAAETARNLWQRIRGGQESGAAPEGNADQEVGVSAGQPAGRQPGDDKTDSGKQPLAGANRPEAQEVIVINVLCRGHERFTGPELKRLLEACGMEYGDMNIYHRHEEPDTRSPVQFSVASAVSPGTFRPDEIEALRTPGISFFMSLPGPSDSIQAFDFMLETAQTVVRNLGGELKDENRSVMTTQTIEHCRQRIREFERKRRSLRV